MVRYNADVGSEELAERLRVARSVLIVAGVHFGIEYTMRLGFGPPEEELRRALGRLGSAFESLRH